ncbi:MAG TPA: hypothetical protein VLG16_04240 [Candidatus Saccharimonadales bacterium]|nr:hypothetical protein [Candidatus Saccharimonadales bacterium]
MDRRDRPYGTEYRQQDPGCPPSQGETYAQPELRPGARAPADDPYHAGNMRPVQYSSYLAAEDPSPLGPYEPVDPTYPPHIVYSGLAESHPGGAALSSPHIPHEFHWLTDEELAVWRTHKALERQPTGGSPQVSDPVARLATYFAMRKAAQLRMPYAAPAQPGTIEPIAPSSSGQPMPSQSHNAPMQETVFGLPVRPQHRPKLPKRNPWSNHPGVLPSVLKGLQDLDNPKGNQAADASPSDSEEQKSSTFYDNNPPHPQQ